MKAHHAFDECRSATVLVRAVGAGRAALSGESRRSVAAQRIRGRGAARLGAVVAALLLGTVSFSSAGCVVVGMGAAYIALINGSNDPHPLDPPRAVEADLVRELPSGSAPPATLKVNGRADLAVVAKGGFTPQEAEAFLAAAQRSSARHGVPTMRVQIHGRENGREFLLREAVFDVARDLDGVLRPLIPPRSPPGSSRKLDLMISGDVPLRRLQVRVEGSFSRDQLDAFITAARRFVEAHPAKPTIDLWVIREDEPFWQRKPIVIAASAGK